MTHHFFVVLRCPVQTNFQFSVFNFQGLADLRHKVGVVHPARELLGTRTDGKNRHGSTRMTVVRPAEFSLVVQYADSRVAELVQILVHRAGVWHPI